jgi:predicted HTH transcriptional regulator
MKSELNYLHKHIEELSTRALSEMGQLHIKSDLFVIGSSKQPKASDENMSFITPKMSFKKEKPILHKNNTPQKETKIQTSVTVQKRPVGESIDREARVIDVIRDKGIVSIKDISSVIFDVSEKTIQRTLNALIDKGQIKKEGERRWAKYQLV